jgi:hypothetical protein
MSKTRDILCDSGAFISLTSTCLERVIYFFAEKHNVRFIIPKSVKYECMDRPLNDELKRYMFSAVRIKDLVDDGVVVVSDVNAASEGKRIMTRANNLFFVKGKPMRLMHSGEAEMLAAAKALGVDWILIDERTTRMFLEAPFQIKDHLEDEFETNVMVNKKNLSLLNEEIGSLNAIRSSELLILAYEKGYFKRYQKMEKKALESALYQAKFSGCSIRFSEIDEYLRWRR